MGERISEKDVQRAMELAAASIGKPWARGNDVFVGSPYADNLESVGKLWDRTGDRNGSFVGAWHLSFAYGGVCVHEMSNEGGGVSTPISYGHSPKRELYDQLQNFRRGAEAKAAEEQKHRDLDQKIWATMSTRELVASADEYESKIANGEYQDDGFLADIAQRIRQEIVRRESAEVSS